MTETDFILSNFDVSKASNGSVTWKTPSNIALVKYWGKQEPQIPENASISFTLDACFTLTTLEFRLKKKRPVTGSEFNFEIFFEGEKKEDFKPKIQKFFERIEQYVPFLKDYDFIIKSRNSFPHSSGIASSASGMSALALCVMSLERLLNGAEMTDEYFNKKASFLARLGSGSACRSIEGELIVWGNHTEIEGSSNLFGTKFPFKIHENFKNYHDTILLVDEDEKQVSSTVGHQLMNNHPFAQQRFQQANDNISKISEIIQKGDLKQFIKIVESEALSLHAMMMTSNPYFILMKPNTLKIINKIWEFRSKTNANICFTLDAGANVHVLFPESEKESVNNFIINELIQFCYKKHYICDIIGNGGTQLIVKNEQLKIGY
ncbi:diphosphomevalonate/mevalonate 3,5-bisphosphate decarboxylase family protein [Lutibacter sp.]|uniref:diphosphomevalonate/mevalonate 3,5-bisphosphate decarboxylase family protein n=1 Tax=Lutibacter sp. TaxID=1925666 RepID=UPI0027345561|nr:diphosphomevalonate decarboxylase [Lutibacter sp.]MDP3313483.1 diphosphomevalonate decarboxylase [Lutibacter sp.]